MFFYKELSPLVIASNVGSLQFSNIAVNASSSMTFTVSAASGEKTETVTLSDNTDQYEFSPSSFSLGEGGSQTITVSFKPTASGPTKTGKITANSSGGSSVVLDLTGSATLHSRYAINNPLSPYIYGSAGSKTPVNPPDGSEGWYFINSTANQSFQYYYQAFPPTQGTIGPNETLSAMTSSGTAYVIARFTSLASAQNAPGKYPILALYTKPLGDGQDGYPGFYRSRLSCSPSGSRGVNSPYSANVDYLFYTNINPAAHPEIPSNRRIKMQVSGTGLRAANEQMISLTVASDTTTIAANGAAIITRNAGAEFTDRLDEMTLLKIGSV